MFLSSVFFMFFSRRSKSLESGDGALRDAADTEQFDLRAWRASLELALLLASFSVLFVSAMCWFGSRQVVRLPLLDTINPNTASAASLVRLPGIGPARAAAIIEYRKNFGKDTPAFACPADLDKISGIGPKTIEKMEPWLSFEEK